MRLKGLDLNLLVALDILMEEHSVSRSAERMHLSQPAASAALGRLRDYFGDDLLVLHGKRMIPTSYAQSLAPKVKRILEEANSLISMSSEFDPSRSERIFQLMASDYITTVLVNPLVTRLRRVAPDVGMDIRLPEQSLTAEFDRGEMDLALVPEEFLADNHPAELVFEETHVVVAWEENPAFNEEISAEAFFDLRHVAVTVGPSRLPSFTERNLAAMDFTRKVAIYAPYFSAVPWLLLGTNRIAVMQERLARIFAPMMPLKIAPMPIEFPLMRLMMQYHSARVDDQGQKWLRRLLIEVANDPYAIVDV